MLLLCHKVKISPLINLLVHSSVGENGLTVVWTLTSRSSEVVLNFFFLKLTLCHHFAKVIINLNSKLQSRHQHFCSSNLSVYLYSDIYLFTFLLSWRSLPCARDRYKMMSYNPVLTWICVVLLLLYLGQSSSSVTGTHTGINQSTANLKKES